MDNDEKNPQKNHQKESYTYEEAAILFGVSVRTISRWLACGWLRAERQGGRFVRVLAESVEELKKTFRVPAKAR